MGVYEKNVPSHFGANNPLEDQAMLNHSRICAAIAVLAAFNAVAQDRKPATSVAAKSIAGTVQTCKGSAQECRIIVRVEPPAEAGGPCLAVIDMETVRVKKGTPVNFMLVRSSMTDSEKYEFVSPGVTWVGTAPTADQFKFLQLAVNGTVAQWTTGNKKTSQDLSYLPQARRVSDGRACDAGDPKIANDG